MTTSHRKTGGRKRWEKFKVIVREIFRQEPSKYVRRFIIFKVFMMGVKEQVK